MKKLLIIVFILLTTKLSAQDHFGIYGASGLSCVSKSHNIINHPEYSSSFKVKPMLSYQIGLFYKKSLGEFSNLYLELLLSKLNGTIDYKHYINRHSDPLGDQMLVENREKKKLLYLSLPIYYSRTWNKWSANLGAQFMYLIDSKESYETYVRYVYYNGQFVTKWLERFRSDKYLKKMDFGVIAGLSYQYKSRLSIHIRYYHGLLNIREVFVSDDKWRNRQLTVGLHYAFN